MKHLYPSAVALIFLTALLSSASSLHAADT